MRTSHFIEGSRPGDLLFLTPLIDPTIVPSGHAVSQQDDFRFTVRFSINGKRWSLCGIQDFETACRFADMFVLRFRKYLRVDAIRWNFSEAQAVADTADDSDRGGNLAKLFLVRAENELQTSGRLIEQVPSQFAVRSSRNRLDVLEETVERLSQIVGALEQQIEQLTQRFPADNHDNQ